MFACTLCLPQTCYVSNDGFELMVFLPLHPECRNYRQVTLYLARLFFSLFCRKKLNERMVFMHVITLPACIYMYPKEVWDSWISKEGIGLPRTGVIESCKVLCRCWESNLGFCKTNKCS